MFARSAGVVSDHGARLRRVVGDDAANGTSGEFGDDAGDSNPGGVMVAGVEDALGAGIASGAEPSRRRRCSGSLERLEGKAI
jgi:hypothetical protein